MSFSPVELLAPTHETPLLLVCDHARNELPAEYATLGLPAAEFSRHIAYDIGARTVTLELARLTGAGAVLSTFSRLLIDPNRGEDDPTLVMRLSDGAIIPGNHPITPQEIENRLKRFHQPYHAAIEAALDAIAARGQAPVILSIHSFTPVWRGHPRPWHAGILWDRDPRLAVPLIDALRADPHIVVGDNEPYDGALENDCMFRHGTRRGFAHAIIEIRQDLIADPAGARHWAQRLAGLLPALLANPAVQAPRPFGSRCGSCGGQPKSA